MADPFNEARRVMRENIQALAEAKLNRRLSPNEQAGIQRISSLMMLESLEDGFRRPTVSAEAVERDLACFSTPNQIKE